MVTLCAQFIIPWVIIHSPKNVTGGPYGMEASAPKIGNITFVTPEQFYPLIMVITVIMTLFGINITRTRPGRAFIAIRDNDIAAEVMGINIKFYKCRLFSFQPFSRELRVHYGRII